LKIATIIKHWNTNIATLDADEAIDNRFGAGDIVIQEKSGGWWTYFIGEDGAIDSYDEPFDSYRKALGAAKAAAEFSEE
jgi:hypothetical protein